MEFLTWLEETRLALFVRESNSLLAYPTILFLHTLGLGTVAGFSAFLDLRVLGFANRLPFASLRPFITTIWVGFVVTAASGTALLVADASNKVRSPVLWIKLIFVALALVTLHLLTKRVFRNPDADRGQLPREAPGLALASLVFWVAATTAGRLMAYIV